MQKVIVNTKRVNLPDNKGYIQIIQCGELVKVTAFSLTNIEKRTADVKLENGVIVTVLLDSIDFVDEFPQENFIVYEK